MRIAGLAVLTLCLQLAALADDLPVVQCPSTAQGEEEPPPYRIPPIPELAPAEKSSLALYVSSGHAVLAPRGWHCFENGGSGGSFLIVSPTGEEPPKGGIEGPAIEVALTYAGTSGRFEAAKIDAQLFPEKQAFVQAVKEEGMIPADLFPAGPSPNDKLARVKPGIIEFTTPAGQEGMGLYSWLKKGPLPIEGVAMLADGGDGDIETVMLRLPAGQEALAPTILSEVERRLAKRRF